MLQTSITAWLKKPKAVTEPPACTAIIETAPPAELPPTEPKASANAVEECSKTSTTMGAAASIRSPALDHSKTSGFSRLKPLPSNITIEPLTAPTLPSFRRLTSVLLPIPYQQKFYDETLSDPIIHSITFAAFWHPIPPSEGVAVPAVAAATGKLDRRPTLISSIRCRLLPSTPNPVLYISTLGTLSPYRQYGCATHLLQHTIRAAVEQHNICAVVAHVWEANTEGLEWYQRRGFSIERKEEGYYRRLKPQSAFIVRKEIGPSDMLGS